MQIAVPSETHANERRVALIPDAVKKLVNAGLEVVIESGAGLKAGFADAEYTKAGATLSTDRDALLAGGDILLRVKKPALEDIAKLKRGALHISYLDPYNETSLIDAMASQGVSAISMEMIPRTTRAQKMDALSSQANLAGYAMVLLAASKLDRILPMMMTPAGTLSPAKVFVIGAGVAGLQAIATAKRLGAKVEAFDTRPVVAEQVQSLGAKFVQIDLGEMGQTKDGYAKELSPEQLELQRLGMKGVISQSDIVITTAQVFGRPAPRIVTKDMVEAMKPGGVIVDMAVESGGNVEGSVADQTVDINGVSIIGVSNLPSEVARDASQMYSSNLFNLVSEYWDAQAKTFNLNLEDDILKGCVITHDGAIVNTAIQNLRK
ncbi:MAG: Re/Si-specific NAD(P)(+) transhydrogenase subunit alpha [Pseudomonadales bacterium]|jgi:H+-translocating NAD(P) transhydrogenase subunit alpha|nr:Re/Si-specific NAD(P)(+) transhydrogenase subunit alpha [Pseudomonadales bacterium]MDP4765991.1 Re/Si-specific NAD(P)(+) transhydrogenase subunit alpha [Pseudomonadales bacterium]MDP5059524.1 Re/Si-specific NAD(P)(+) transhydrogenase subunit alpha [Pseudomonadales bacterium]